MGNNQPKRRDSACFVAVDGSLSNALLHEQMIKGVDDHDFRMQTRAELLAAGVPITVLDSVLPFRRVL
jgi:hypothetical protein